MNNTLVEKKFECFEIEIKEKIAHIILNRPEKMNSMPPSFWSDLPEICLLYTSPSPRDQRGSRMPSSA